MLAGHLKRVFTGGPAGPAGATLAAALTDVTAGMKAVLTAPNLAAARAGLGLAIGSSVQAWSASLDALAALATTAFGRSLLTQADAPAALQTLGAVPTSRQVTAGAGLSGGGDLSADRSFALAGIATGTLLANTSAGPAAAAPIATTPAALLDAAFGATRGTVLVRAASGWSALALGASGYTLQSNGTDLVYAAASPGAGAVRNDTAQNPNAAAIAQALANVGALFQPQGRLTLTSGVPVLAGAVTAAAVVYYTPNGGDLALIGTGLATPPVPVVFAEVSQALSDATKSPGAAAAGNVYDLFAWLDGSTFRVTRGPAWSAGATAGSNTQRGSGAGSSALTRVGGVLVNAVAITNGPAAGFGVHVGTIATDAGGATVTFNPGTAAAGGGAAWIGFWNAFNREPVAVFVRDSNASWTYAGTAMRAADNSAGNRITFVSGAPESVVSAEYSVRVNPGATTAYGFIGIGLDSTTALAAGAVQAMFYPNSAGGQGTPLSPYRGAPGLGLHYLQALESSDSAGDTITFIGGSFMGFTAQLRF
ncbi:hypothetical protein [Methylobacterium sp. 391_Methyba4]|uniref:hypothetical protein n=1 Tax=Methylobacterium sp. 391_Methyba4 TaxID=3038924 RepID=UPI00241EECF0|nr:hypothetical protein [Methylobacterium sp. 391_Methyba4]WFS07794.1 hypothetical protein P9K36_00355 [Methylobacterium sp. 391_Methyba4]